MGRQELTSVATPATGSWVLSLRLSPANSWRKRRFPVIARQSTNSDTTFLSSLFNEKMKMIKFRSFRMKKKRNFSNDARPCGRRQLDDAKTD